MVCLEDKTLVSWWRRCWSPEETRHVGQWASTALTEKGKWAEPAWVGLPDRSARDLELEMRAATCWSTIFSEFYISFLFLVALFFVFPPNSMPSILNLKFKVCFLSFFQHFLNESQGNKSFVAFSNLNDTEALTKTWKVCHSLHSFPTSLKIANSGVYQGSELPWARSTPRELELEVMAHSEPYGWHRQCQVQARI